MLHVVSMFSFIYFGGVSVQLPETTRFVHFDWIYFYLLPDCDPLLSTQQRSCQLILLMLCSRMRSSLSVGACASPCICTYVGATCRLGVRCSVSMQCFIPVPKQTGGSSSVPTVPSQTPSTLIYRWKQLPPKVSPTNKRFLSKISLTLCCLLPLLFKHI